MLKTLTDKYGRPAESLVRALMHEERLLSGTGGRQSFRDPSAMMGCLFFLAVIVISPVFLVVFEQVIMAIIHSGRDTASESTALILFVLAALFFGGLGAAFIVWRKLTDGHYLMERQLAEDKVDSLLTMASLHWKIDRVVLPNKHVEYRLIMPKDENSQFSGSPAIVMGPRSAEKADLLILVIKEDQRLVDKWTNRTGPTTY